LVPIDVGGRLMINIMAIPSVIYLVMVLRGSLFVPPRIVIQEMPTMHMCESVGEWISHATTATYTCIEGPRDE
jgi:hypothetical protein